MNKARGEEGVWGKRGVGEGREGERTHPRRSVHAVIAAREVVTEPPGAPFAGSSCHFFRGACTERETALVLQHRHDGQESHAHDTDCVR